MSAARQLRAAGAFAAAILCMNAGADSYLIDESFQDPIYASNTANPTFAGWTYVSGNVVKSRTSTAQADLPHDADYAPNQAIQLEWTSGLARYALTHAWSTDDVFFLTLNASPQAWNIARARWIRPKIRQNSDNTVLWDPGETAETKLYQEMADPNPWAWNGPGPYGNGTWQDFPELLYTFTINASEFTAGTPGQTIYLELGSSGERGMFYDNVQFGLVPPPPPGGTIIMLK